ncbi:MAG: T9SS type A sorting domain-containing protein [Saprospiraceae bacterium]|nr:T9SS type A sorting domain-containing protein [Saprospiraceae bacterium]
MKAISAIILVLLKSFCFSQEYFNKVIPSSQYYVEGSSSQVLELNDSTIAIIINAEYRDKPGQLNKLCLLNSEGNLISLNSYLDSINYVNVFDVIRNRDNYFLAGLKYNSVTKLNDFWISKTNRVLDTIWTKHFRGIYNRCKISKIYYGNDNKLILAGTDNNVRVTGTFINGRSFIFSLDSVGNFEFYTRIQGQDTVNQEGYFDVLQVKNGSIYACGTSAKFNLDQEPLIVKLSPDGKLVWRKQIVEPKYNEVLNNIYYQDDGTLLCVGGSFNGLNNGVQFTYILLESLDTLGNLLWTKRIVKGYKTYLYNTIQDSKSDIICTGSFQASPTYIQDGWIAKITSNGDSLWSRVINHDDSTSEGFSHISQASDGGYYLTGYSWVPGDNSSKAWIVKTDSFGCVVPGCEKVVRVEDIKNGKEKAFVMFPNPVVSKKFFFLSRIGSGETYQLKIFNLQGEVIQTYNFRPHVGTQDEVDLNASVASGLYIVNIINEIGKVIASEKMEVVN